MKNRTTWILTSAMAVLTALFFGYEVPDRIRIDGLTTEGVLMNTQYADDYSHAGFRRIKARMTEKEVLDILGEPLSRFGPYTSYGIGNTHFPEKGQYVCLQYSKPPNLINTNYRARLVVLDNGMVVEVYGRFSADRGLRELPHTQRDDPAAFHQLLLGDHQRRCETDNVAVRGFREQAVVTQQQAQFPSGLR